MERRERVNEREAEREKTQRGGTDGEQDEKRFKEKDGGMEGWEEREKKGEEEEGRGGERDEKRCMKGEVDEREGGRDGYQTMSLSNHVENINVKEPATNYETDKQISDIPYDTT